MKRRLLSLVLAGVLTMTSVLSGVYAAEGDILEVNDFSQEVLGELVEEDQWSDDAVDEMIDDSAMEMMVEADESETPGEAETEDNELLIEDPELEEEILQAAVNENNLSLIWIGEDVSTGYSTLNDAVAAANAGDVIHISEGVDAAALAGAAVNKAVTVQIEGNVNVSGDGTSACITLASKSGAVLQCAPGGSLTMSNFGVALTTNPGTTISDGTYTFEKNTNTTHGILIGGAVKGSTDKNSISITAHDKYESNFYGSAATFENCAVDVYTGGTGIVDSKPLNMTNAAMTIQKFGNPFYASKMNLVNSELTLKNFSASTTTVWGGGPFNISNSVVNISGGLRASLSLGGGEFNFTDGSVLSFTNGGIGNFNINTGRVTFVDSTLKGDGNAWGALFGVQNKNETNFIKFTGSSRVETPAKSTNDNGLDQLGNAYIVLGGSHKIYYTAADQYGYKAAAVPVNGADHGNERLSYFKLADPSVNELTVVDINGASYTYPVANPSSDGNKYVWVPIEKISFKLNRTGAKFADGTTADKTLSAMRGSAVTMAATANKVNVNAAAVNNPTCSGYLFGGWYTDPECTAGNEFEPASNPVNTAMTVYAKWMDPNSRGVTYHTNLPDKDAQYEVLSETAPYTVTVLSYEAVTALSSSFAAPEGYTFKGWNAEKDGSGTSYAADDTVEFGADNKHTDLYAQWEAIHFNVTFDANGGNGTMDPQEMAYGTATILNANTFTKEGYIFRGWASEADASEAELTDGAEYTITADTILYAVWSEKPVQPLQMEIPISADIWGSSRDTSKEVQNVKPGQPITLTGSIKTDVIKQQMSLFVQKFAGTDTNTVTLTGTTCEFTAVITLPDEITASDISTASNGFGDSFEVTDTVVSGQKVTVTIKLKADGTDTFEKLAAAVNATDDWMDLTLSGLKIAENAEVSKDLTATGEINGAFHAVAEDKDVIRNFEMTFSGSQWADGKDVRAEDDQIQYTLALAVPVKVDAVLPADILIGTDTEHDRMYETKAGAVLDYTGAVNVSSIREQMQSVKAMFPNADDSMIKTAVNEFGFTAIFAAGDGLRLPDRLDSSTVTEENFGSGFEITDVRKDGNAVTVTFGIRDAAKITSFAQVADIVNNAGDENGWMKVTIPGIKVADTIADGTRLTVTGKVEGSLKADIQYNDIYKTFAFHWNGVQSSEGRDAVIEDTSDTTIQFTAESVEYFYVYHSSDKTKEGIRMKEYSRNKLDITRLVKSGYIYGGTYRNASLTNPYSIDDDGFSGMAVTPASGTTYYLKEVDEHYLRVSVSSTYDKANNNKLKFLDLLLATDDTNYFTAGFLLTQDGNTETKLTMNNKIYEQYAVEQSGGNKTVHTAATIYSAIRALTAEGRTYGRNAANGGYLAYSEYNKSEGAGLEAGKTFSVQGFWITPDGVKVTGTTVKNIATGDGTKNKGTGLTSNNSPESENAQHYSCTALTAEKVAAIMANN